MDMNNRNVIVRKTSIFTQHTIHCFFKCSFVSCTKAKIDVCSAMTFLRSTCI